MAKKPEQNIEVQEIAFNFPSVEIDGVFGKTIYAKSKEEAEEKLKQFLNKNLND